MSESMSEQTDDTRLLDVFLRLMRELRQHYDASAKDIGLTMSRARVVTRLARMEGATQAELSAAMGIEAPSLKRQLDALDEAGFIERRGLARDARKRALFLTEKGKSSKVSFYLEQISEDLLAGVSEEDQAVTRATLQTITQNAVKLGLK
nr:MarR family transcriptional regulator [uncultured Celeribacter sp.]